MFPANDLDAPIFAPRPRYVCPRCEGRGFLVSPIPNEWPIHCPLCKGRTSFSSCGLAKLIAEAPSTIDRLEALRVKPRTAEHLLSKLADLR